MCLILRVINKILLGIEVGRLQCGQHFQRKVRVLELRVLSIAKIASTLPLSILVVSIAVLLMLKFVPHVGTYNFESKCYFPPLFWLTHKCLLWHASAILTRIFSRVDLPPYIRIGPVSMVKPTSTYLVVRSAYQPTVSYLWWVAHWMMREWNGCRYVRVYKLNALTFDFSKVNGTDSGHLRVDKYSATVHKCSQYGPYIKGEASDDQFGTSTS